MRTPSLSGVALFCGLVIASALGQSKTVSLPSPTALATEMAVAQAKSRPQASYQLIRKYRVFPSNNVNVASEVVAVVGFRPPTTESYTIQKTSGDRQTEHVVRGILDHEVEASTQGRHVPTAAVIQDNYDVSYPGESVLGGHPCYLFGLSPSRTDKNLIVGKAWVDERSFLVREINGDLVKTPSWWLKKVHVKISFDNVGGIWLQTATEAIADVRVLGSHTLASEIVEFRNTEIAAQTPAVPRAHYR